MDYRIGKNRNHQKGGISQEYIPCPPDTIKPREIPNNTSEKYFKRLFHAAEYSEKEMKGKEENGHEKSPT